MIFHNISQNTDEWLELRRGKFTASIFNDLFMKETTATYQNALYKVAYERMTNDVPESYTNYDMQRGHDLQPEAQAMYELETFNKVHNGGFFTHSDFVGASPDGLIGEDGLIEIKCPKYNTMIGYLLNSYRKKVPLEYMRQIQGQLYITNRKWCDFASYHPKLRPLIIRVERDEEMISEIQTILLDSTNRAIQIIKKLTEL